jgi:hypothetical protein
VTPTERAYTAIAAVGLVVGLVLASQGAWLGLLLTVPTPLVVGYFLQKRWER